MLEHDHLSLFSLDLATHEVWTPAGDSLFLVFPTNGAGQWLSGTLAQPLAQGDVLAVNAASPCIVRAGESGHLSFRAFSVAVEHLWPLCAAHEVGRLEGILESLKIPRFHAAASPVARECHDLLQNVPAGMNVDHRSQLLRVAAAILAEEFNHAPRALSGFVHHYEHLAQELLRLSAGDLLNFSVEELAEKLSCSPRHLNRLFNSRFNRSVGALKMEMRLLRAASLLMNPDAKVINVAERSGFTHLGLFNKCFKRRFGICPTKWRRQTCTGTNALSFPQPNARCPLRAHGLCAWLNDIQTTRNCVTGDGARPNTNSPRNDSRAPARSSLITPSPRTAGLASKSPTPLLYRFGKKAPRAIRKHGRAVKNSPQVSLTSSGIRIRVDA